MEVLVYNFCFLYEWTVKKEENINARNSNYVDVIIDMI